jgi:hypothetical protein
MRKLTHEAKPSRTMWGEVVGAVVYWHPDTLEFVVYPTRDGLPCSKQRYHTSCRDDACEMAARMVQRMADSPL